MKEKILFVEDNVQLQCNLAEYFENLNFDLDFASDGLTALHLLANNNYSLVVLDIMLPGVNGINICKQIRQNLNQTVPIILLTALDTINDKVAGFEAGANDYLCKPFSLKELELCISELLKRNTSSNNILTAGNIKFNSGCLRVSNNNGIELNLSGISASLFELLIRSYPDYVSFETISDTLWGLSDIDEHTIRTHIYTLRKSLKNTFGKSLIKGIYGRGYQLSPHD